MRQYVTQDTPDTHGLLTVRGKDYRYMKQVLRLSAGDMLNVRLPDGRLQGMTVCKIEEASKRIILQVCAASPAELGADSAQGGAATAAEPTQADDTAQLELWLFQFVARSAKMDTIIRQATECGVSVIVPVIGEFSQAGAKERNFRGDRYERIIKEARQQSGSAVNTRVLAAHTLAEAIALWNAHCAERCTPDTTGASCSALGLVLYERTEQTKPLHAAVAQALHLTAQHAPDDRHPTALTAALVCGAEGGISPAELTQLITAHFVPIHFKTNILRCETAALYGIAALQTAVSEGKLWQCKE